MVNRFLSAATLAPLAALGALTLLAAPAEAFSLSPGDRLFGSSTFQINGDASTSLDFDFYDTLNSTWGAGGSMTVNKVLSTTPFDSYDNLKIQDVNFGAVSAITNFISAADFSIDWNNLSINQDVVVGSFRLIDIQGDAVFRDANSSNIAYGVGSATGQLKVDLATGQANFDYDVEDVPEPFTILGTSAALGIGTLLKKRRDQKQAAANA